MSSRGSIIETWEINGGYFKVRAVAFEEEILWGLHGSYYVYYSSLSNEDSWKEVMVTRLDDFIALPRDNVKFIGSRLGYIYFIDKYSVTTDGGQTWSHWEAAKNISDWSGYKYGYIRDVTILPDGTGQMILRPKDDPTRTEITNVYLKTDDYGLHWRMN